MSRMIKTLERNKVGVYIEMRVEESRFISNNSLRQLYSFSHGFAWKIAHSQKLYLIFLF